MEYNNIVSKLPNFLIEKLNLQYNEEITKKIIEGYGQRRVSSFRVNTLKSNVCKIEKILIENKINYNKVSWYNEAFIVENEESLRKLDIYKNGDIYMQSLSSMLPPLILNPKENYDILDMAAAPGGKTTQIAALTNNKANITACEMNKVRAERLKYNIEKQGAKVFVMVKDAKTIDNFFSFDQILLDSPCSGSGTLNVENEKLNEVFTPKLIQKSVKAQNSLLQKAIKILKTGQEMVYSTCSILSCENEEIINNALEQKNIEIVPIEFDKKEDLPLLPSKIEGTICVMPNKFYEGFFIAKIKKIK